jgi:protein-disulfide isomerase
MTKKQSQATKQANAERAAERAAAIRKENERKERRRRTLTVTAVVGSVLAAILIIGYAVQSTRDTTGQATTPPSGVTDKYELAVGEPGAPVTVTVYEDFMCPFCGDFEAASRDMLRQYVDQGDVQVRYHVLSFLDRASNGTDYSTRATNALGVVLDTAGPDVAKKFHDLLYEHQPEEGSDGLSDAELVDFAVQAGAEESQVQAPIEDVKFEQWVKNSTDAASKKDISQTPTVLVDGSKLDGATIDGMVTAMKQEIDAKLAG